MAAEPFTTTRRTLLGAAVALPALRLSAIPPRDGGCPTRIIAPADDNRGQLLVTVPNSTQTWNRRLAAYRRRHASWKHEAEAGAFHAANDEYNRHYNALSARFGSWHEALRSPIGAPLCRAAFAPMNAAEEAFHHDFTAPLQRAAVRLALTPAPDLPALLAKIRVMHEHELDELEGMARPALEVLAENVELLP
jgi:hypothetical protein